MSFSCAEHCVNPKRRNSGNQLKHVFAGMLTLCPEIKVENHIAVQREGRKKLSHSLHVEFVLNPPRTGTEAGPTVLSIPVLCVAVS